MIINSNIPNPPYTHDRSYSWWYLRHYVCVQNDKTSDKSGDEKFKEIIIQDYSAWTLFVSLLMTVDMSALLGVLVIIITLSLLSIMIIMSC